MTPAMNLTPENVTPVPVGSDAMVRLVFISENNAGKT